LREWKILKLERESERLREDNKRERERAGERSEFFGLGWCGLVAVVLGPPFS
jgi:hypothetical protein